MFATPARSAANQVTSVPAPVGGLNAYDSLIAMPPSDAYVLQNWWPQPYGVTVRQGYRAWATGMPAQVETLAAWANTDGSQKFFAWSNISMYDITVPGAVGAPIVTTLNNAIWDSVNLVNSAGSHLIALNGIDDGIIYNNLGVARITAGDGIVLNTWAGISPNTCVSPVVHQHRLWVVEKNTANGWFLPPDAVQGTFLKFDFGPLFSLGGFLQFLSTWTLDDGNGAEDHLIAVSSRGEAAVYSGTNPEDDQAWFLVGVYNIGAPVAGRRAHCKAGGDQYILTQQGVVSMTNVLASTKVNESQDKLKSSKIQFLLSELIALYSASFGWDMKYYPKQNMLLINVPSITIGGNIQLAANQITGAWTEFLAIDAVCWGTFGSAPFFGDYDGRVHAFWIGNKDAVPVDGNGGTNIVSRVAQAYSYLGSPATQKQVGMYQPTFITENEITISSTILYDFKTETPTPPSAAAIDTASLWGIGLWGVAVWGGGSAIQKQWIQAEGMGVATSLCMVTQTAAEVLWVATNYSYVNGQGIL